MSYRKVIGMGGIGYGILFLLDGHHTLGRDESRAARLSGARDYCKGHIIMHYIAALSGCETHIIGCVGDDERGRELLEDMKANGIGVRYVGRSKDAPTMLSVCYQYPDRSGGNITSSNSACNLVDREYVTGCLETLSVDHGCIAVAAPETPLDGRLAFMEYAHGRGALVISSFLSGEAGDFAEAGGLAATDILAVNIDEARAVSGAGGDTAFEAALICRDAVRRVNPGIRLAVTAGKEGAYLFEGEGHVHVPIIDVPVKSTAGAGDAFIAGVACGIARGLPFLKAGGLGAVVSNMSVMSEDTIARGVSLPSVLEFMRVHYKEEEIFDVIQAAVQAGVQGGKQG